MYKSQWGSSTLPHILYYKSHKKSMLVVQTILFLFAIHTLTGQYTERHSRPEAAPNRDSSDSQQHHTPPDSEPEDLRGSVLPWSCVQCWGSVHCCMWDPRLPGCPLGGIVLARTAQVPPPVDAIHWGWIGHTHHGLYNTGVAVGVAVGMAVAWQSAKSEGPGIAVATREYLVISSLLQ